MTTAAPTSNFKVWLDTIGFYILGIIWLSFVGLYLFNTTDMMRVHYFFVALICYGVRHLLLTTGLTAMLCWAAFWGAHAYAGLDWGLALLMAVPVIPLCSVDEVSSYLDRRIYAKRVPH